MTASFQIPKRCLGPDFLFGFDRQRPNPWLIVTAIALCASFVISVPDVAAQQDAGSPIDAKEEESDSKEEETIDAEKRETSTKDEEEDEEESKESLPDEAEDRDEAEDQPPSEEAKEPERRKAVIFNVLEESDPAILNLILEALQAQLSDIDVELVFNGGVNESSELRNLIEKGKSMAQPYDAVGVFWLDANHGENWLLYLVDPEGERVLVRRAGAGLESLTATVESVAVITRSSSKALIDGRVIGLRSSEKIDDGADRWTELRFQTKNEQVLRREIDQREREKAIEKAASVDQKGSDEKAALSEPAREQLRFALAYRGTTFAPQVPWQSGIGFWAGWLTPIDIYVGLGFLLTPDANVTKDLTEVPTTFNNDNDTSIGFWIERFPFELFSGYQYRLDPFAFEGELGGILDKISRRSKPTSKEQPVDATKPYDRSGIVFGLFLRGRAEYFLERHWAIFIGLGLEYFLRNFDYVAELGKTEILLEPNSVRFDLEVGMAFHM